MGTATIAPWKQLLLNAMQSNSHLKHSSYFQLATIGINGRPANRTVVFRGFQDNSDKIQINTDSRTHKIIHLNPQQREVFKKSFSKGFEHVINVNNEEEIDWLTPICGIGFATATTEKPKLEIGSSLLGQM